MWAGVMVLPKGLAVVVWTEPLWAAVRVLRRPISVSHSNKDWDSGSQATLSPSYLPTTHLWPLFCMWWLEYLISCWWLFSKD